MKIVADVDTERIKLDLSLQEFAMLWGYSGAQELVETYPSIEEALDAYVKKMRKDGFEIEAEII